jgi:hypothetical protein
LLFSFYSAAELAGVSPRSANRSTTGSIGSSFPAASVVMPECWSRIGHSGLLRLHAPIVMMERSRSG